MFGLRLLAQLPLALITGIVILSQTATVAAPSARAETAGPGMIGALVIPEQPGSSEPDDSHHRGVDPAEIQRWADRAHQLYQNGEIEDAMLLYLRAAAAGNLTALYNAAVIRITGQSYIPTLEAALEMLRQSADAGFPPAQFSYGMLFEAGTIMPQDRRTARKWYRRAAEQGHPQAAGALAACYYLGRGGAQDYRQAAHWYRAAAVAGDAMSQFVLASMFERGLGVEADLERALHWYRAAAMQGDVAAEVKQREIAAHLAAPQEQ